MDEPNPSLLPSPSLGRPHDRRRFNATEHVALFLTADGNCTQCGTALEPGWHADHITPYAAGGKTDIANGQALCPTCNLKKGTTVAKGPRIWQQRATEAFYANTRKDFLVSATPGAGKTRYALDLANQLLGQGLVDRIVVVVPTDALRRQWADAAAARGLQLMPVSEDADYSKTGYMGCVVSYQQLLGDGAKAVRNVTRRATLAILDEVHHAGDNRSWGESLQNAVESATYRLSLTGTPWRRDSQSPIPFVEYDANGTVVVDYAYEYGEAVADEVCRRIEFHAYDGEARWIDPARGRREYRKDTDVRVEFTAKLGANMDEADVSAALDAVYEPNHQWMPAMLKQADTMLGELRGEIPDAAGLVVCERQWHAHGYAKILEQITGTLPPVVVSDPKADPGGKLAKKTIDDFRDGTGRWIVAVKMISEGVDIPRLAVGVYASKTQTPLFFRQVVGRFVRVRDNEELNARLLIPAVPELMRHAREIEDELRHQLELAAEQDEKARAEASGDGSQGLFDFREPLSASEPVFDRAILGGQESTPDEVAAAEAQCRALGIPTRFAVNLVPLLRGQAASPAVAVAAQATEMPRHRREKLLRGEIKTLVGKVAYRAGRMPQEVNIDLLRQGHPKRGEATVEELEAIRATLVRWFGELL